MNGPIVCVPSEAGDPGSVARVAGELARSFDAELVVVGIVSDVDVVAEEGGPATQSLLRERLAALVDPSVDVTVHYVVAAGAPLDVVLDVAEDEEAALIVVGAAPGVLRRTLRSPLARDLAALALCPVLVVPPSLDSGSLGDVLVAGSRAAR